MANSAFQKSSKFFKRILIFVVVLAGGVGIYQYKVVANRPIEPIKCSDFKFQEDAQAFYWKNKAFYLDGPNREGTRDGVACSSLPHKPKE